MIKKITLASIAMLSMSSIISAQKNGVKNTTPIKSVSKVVVGLPYKKTVNNLEYYFFKDEVGTKYIKDGSVVKMHIRTKIADSAMFDSYKMNNNTPIEQPLTKQFLGAFMEGFQLLTPGDSAVLRLPIDSAFKGTPLPPFAKSGDKVTYEVKVFSVKTPEEADKEKKELAQKQIGVDDKLIQDYIKKNNLKTEKTASGIYYIIKRKGNGVHPTAADKVKVNYKGYKMDGSTFDSSYDRGQPIEFPLSGVIKGWTEGIPLMEVGGQATYLIPSTLAYGQNSPPGSTIKPNEVLLFDVELLDIVKDQPKIENEMKLDSKRTTVNNTEDAQIQAYLKANNLTAQKTASGLYYIIERKGNGKHATAADNVKVHYKGTILDGTQFDSSYDRGEPITFPLTAVIKGWTEGIPLFEEGGKGKLIIPSAMAYGANPPQGTAIKANDPLVFDVELLEIIKK